MNRVLIVDDKESTIHYLHALLTGHHYTVSSARNGAEALVQAQQSPPDIVISDLLMPVMDGYTLLRHWKADAKLHHAPFIVYTATYIEPEDEQLALQLGADAFITKPAEPDVLLAQLRALHNKATPAASVPVKTPIGKEKELLRVYNQTLVRKLEERTLQLSESNRVLEQDIAKRKLLETSLRESERLFRELTETINEVFWIAEPTMGRMLYVSPACERIWGRSRQSFYNVPQSWLETVHPDDRERVRQALRTKLTTGDYDEEYRIVHTSGAVRWIKDRGFPVYNPEGKLERVLGVARDVTDQRKLEEQFRQAQKMEAIGQLASGIAHDFNNILGVILIQAGMIMVEKDLSDPVRNMAVEIEKATQRAEVLTSQLLLFSRKQTMQAHDIDLNDVVTTGATMLRIMLGKEIHLQIILSPAPAMVHADTGMIDQVLLNLTLNARDAMPEGGKLVIEISIVNFDKVGAANMYRARPGSFARVRVTDNGSGIPSEILPQIFEPFFTTKDVGRGTGLGLATVFGIVQQHQGWIGVSSEVDQGTTFQCFFPSLTSSSEAKFTAALPESTRGGKEAIMVVEDDSFLSASVQNALSRLGYRVFQAPSGVAALEVWKLHGNEIRLLLTDLMLPGGMTGKALAEQLVQNDPKLKVMYASGYNGITAGKGMHLEEGVNFIAKPFEVWKLARTVRKCLDRK
jgi:two-component system, cell cycle sensor histidine kinase and response regulator CckA